MQLRYYQREAVDAIYSYLRRHKGSPCAVLPTGAGKSAVIAQMASDCIGTGGRVLILAHVKELLQQIEAHLAEYLPAGSVGLYSAGLGRKELRPVTVAGIQSVWRIGCEILDGVRAILVDEAHLLPVSGEGMYRTLLADAKTVAPAARLVGVTATPYRLDCGMICGPDNLLTDICYEARIRPLIADGYLCKLISRAGTMHADTERLHVRGGEYVADEMAAAFDSVLVDACKEILVLTASRKSVLVFCASVEHAEQAAQILGGRCIHGESTSKEREQAVEDFRAGRLRYLTNCQVYTTGFDARNVDAVCLLRSTLSPGLYYQMVGRGLRTASGKADCLVLDYGENILRHGPIDQVEPQAKSGGVGGTAPCKTCPQCQTILHAAYQVCRECGYEFPPSGPRHGEQASTAPIISEPELLAVKSTLYSLHRKKGAAEGHPPTMRVTYDVGTLERPETVSEFVCFDHQGFAREKAEKWWAARCRLPPPESCGRGVELAKAGWLAETTQVEVIQDGKFRRVAAAEIGEIPTEPRQIRGAVAAPTADESF